MSEQGDEAFRIEHDSMGEVRVPRDALWRAQTQRAVENFPISGRAASSARTSARSAPIKARGRRGQRRARRRSTRTSPQAIDDAAAEVARGDQDDALPDRRLPDRLRHVDQHERQRGHRHPRRPSALGRDGAPQRPRQRLAVVQRRLPHRPSTSPRPAPSSDDLMPALRHLEAVAVAQGASSSPTS